VWRYGVTACSASSAAISPDRHQVERVNPGVGEVEAPGVADGVTQPDRPPMLEQDHGRGRVGWQHVIDVPDLVGKDVLVGRRLRRSHRRALLHRIGTPGPESDQRAGEGAELTPLLVAELTGVRALDAPVGVLAHEQHVDHANDVVFAETLELRLDLAVELAVLEADHEQLYRSD